MTEAQVPVVDADLLGHRRPLTGSPVAGEPLLITQLREAYPRWRFWRGLGVSENRPWNATRRHQIDWRSRPKGYAATLFGTPEELREQLAEQPEPEEGY